MKTHRLLLLAIIGAALVLVSSASVLWAQLGTSPQSADLFVRASVAARCNVTTTEVNFGVYDPTVGTPTDQNGTVNIQCTKGTSATIDMDNGNYFAGGSRRMKSQTLAADEFLTYQLSSVTAGGTPWGTGVTGGTTKSYTAADASIVSITVFGRLNAGQDVSVDDYEDTVVVTATF